MTHAILSASASAKWMGCPGSLAMEVGKPDGSSEHARMGTALHSVAAWCLEESTNAAAYVGRTLHVEGDSIEITDDMAELVQVYVDTVREYQGPTGQLLVEQRVDYSDVLGVPDSFGTSDCILIVGNTMIVIDAKFGYNPVPVDGPQLKLYALGGLPLVELFAEIDQVCLVISQPRVSKRPSELSMSIDELREFAVEARAAAQLAFDCIGKDEAALIASDRLNPSEDACKYCKAKATCPALRAEVADMVRTCGVTPATPDEFERMEVGMPVAEWDHKWLAACLSKVDMIEDWCAAVRKEAEARLHAGESVPGFKLVQGKKGNRKWTSEEEVEQLLKSMRLKQDEMYDFKLISPTTAEKLLKESPKRWTKVQALITQAEGKPTIAPESDKRPALTITNVADDFADIA